MELVPIINEPNFLNLLATFALRSERYLATVVPLLQASDFNREEEKPFRLLWSVVKDWWDKEHKLIPKDLLMTDITARLKLAPSYMSPEDLQKLLLTIDDIYKRTDDPDLGATYMIEQTEMFMKDRRLRTLAIQFGHSDPMDMQKHFDAMVKKFNSATIASGAEIDVFNPNKLYLYGEKRQSTQVPYFDVLTGGGIKGGEVIGLLGITGGGKTTMGMEVALAMAARSNPKVHTAYFTYETDIHPDLTKRMYVYAAGLTRTDLNDPDNIDPAVREKIKAVCAEYRDHFHPVDMKGIDGQQGSGGVPEIVSKLREMRQRGIHVKLVVIDQFLPMITRYMAKKNIPSTERRVIMQNFTQELMDMARASAMDTTVILLHQVATSELNRRPAQRPKLSDSAECRSFPFWLSNVITLGTVDERTGLLWAASTKARDVAKQGIILRLDGLRCRFDMSDKFACRYGELVDGDNPTNSLLPDDSLNKESGSTSGYKLSASGGLD